MQLKVCQDGGGDPRDMKAGEHTLRDHEYEGRGGGAAVWCGQKMLHAAI